MTEAADEGDSCLGEATYPTTLFSCQQSLEKSHPFSHIFPSNLKNVQQEPAVLDSYSLLDTSSVTLSEGFGLCDD